MTSVGRIKRNILKLKKFDFSACQENLTRRKYEAAKKSFCNVLFIENSPLFVEEVLWRFLVSPPSSFNQKFSEVTFEVAKDRVKQGFAHSAENYMLKAKYLNQQIKLKGNRHRFIYLDYMLGLGISIFNIWE